MKQLFEHFASIIKSDQHNQTCEYDTQREVLQFTNNRIIILVFHFKAQLLSNQQRDYTHGLFHFKPQKLIVNLAIL